MDVIFMSMFTFFWVHFLAVVVEELLVHLEPWKSVVGHEMYTARVPDSKRIQKRHELGVKRGG